MKKYWLHVFNDAIFWNFHILFWANLSTHNRNILEHRMSLFLDQKLFLCLSEKGAQDSTELWREMLNCKTGLFRLTVLYCAVARFSVSISFCISGVLCCVCACTYIKLSIKYTLKCYELLYDSSSALMIQINRNLIFLQ